MATFKYDDGIGVDSIAALQALARSSGIPFSVSSAYRPGDPLYHGKHNAIDMVGTKVNMRRLAAYLYQYSDYLLELIHSNGKYFVSNGNRLATMTPRIVADHWDHVHLAATNSGVIAAGQGRAQPAVGGKGVGCLGRTTVLIGSLSLTMSGLIYGGYQWLT